MLDPRRARVLGLLADGLSLRETARVSGVYKDLVGQIARDAGLVLRVGEGNKGGLDEVSSARARVTVFEGVPTMYGALLAAASQAERTPDLSSLRLAVSGGASLPLEVMRRFEETFGATILEGYGLSETSPVASFNHPDRERKADSIGIPVRGGVEMKLTATDGTDVDPGDTETVGEVCIRGENILKGYWQRPDATAEVIAPTGGSTPATSRAATRTVSTTSSTAPRT